MPHVLYHRQSEFTGTLCLIAWGIVLALPGNTFGLWQGYEVFTRWGGEVGWGLTFLIVGMLRLLALVANGMWSLSPWVRVGGAALSMSMFGGLATLYAQVPGSGLPTAVGVYSVLALSEWFAMLRAVGDAVHAKRAREATGSG